MKDYTFFTKTEKKKFILGYRYMKNKIIVYFADGSIIPYNFTIDNLEKIQKMVAEQIKIAYSKYKIEKDNWLNAINTFEDTLFDYIFGYIDELFTLDEILYFLKLTFFIITRGRDLEKYNLFSDILSPLQAMATDKKFLSFFPIMLKIKLVLICVKELGQYNLSLNNADDFSLQEIKKLKKAVEKLDSLGTMGEWI